MPPPFREITIVEFADLLENFPFSRTINSVHMHHTWRPRHADYRGRLTLEGMWRYHTQVNGWSDIAQHITIGPEGQIWTGRGWNEPPASARGHNGNRSAGPFMFEMIGDFDNGRDPFHAPQLDVAIEVIARVQRQFDLSAESLRFHNQLSTKSCPGTSIDYATIVAAVEELRAALARQPLQAPAAAADSPFPDAARASSERDRGVLIELLSGESARTSDPPDAEPAEDMPPLDPEMTRSPGYTLTEIRARATVGRQSVWDARPTPQNYRANDSGNSRADSARGGRRRALCVGINTYPTAPLFGCVADARNWADALERLGFKVSVLFDKQASRQAILSELFDLVGSGEEGDVLVFQYSGHGTNVPNINNDDEIDARDEAICPHDFATGALIIDDDVAEVFASVREGVNLTSFMDCCHSQTNTRFGIGPTARAPRGSDSRPRLVPPTSELDQAYIEFRRSFGKLNFTPRRARGLMRNASFAACLDRELAWESNAQGDFTRIAVPLLQQVGQGITNAEFAGRVETAFGPNPRQHPRLDAAVSVREQLLLQPATRAFDAGSNTNGKPTSEFSSVAQALRAFASLIESKST